MSEPKRTFVDQKIAVVTGGSRGIGRAIAEGLAHDGCTVAVLDVEPLEGGGSEAMTCYECDVSDVRAVEGSVGRIGAELGSVGVLVNNAGILSQGYLQDVADSDWAAVLAVNLSGAFYCTRAVLPSMLERRGGRIISITSITAVRGEPRTAAYAASKGGLIGLTKALARETAGRGVTVNAIAPGFILTDQTRSTFSGRTGELLERQIPMRRFGLPDDVAGLARFLASEGAAYITGQVFIADGGVC